MEVAVALPIVDVAVDPFVLRSALHAALADDDRFEVVLCPRDEDPCGHATAVGADVVIVSRVPVVQGRLVVALLHDPPGLSVTRDGLRQDVVYGGIDTLAQTLAGAGRPHPPG